LCILGADHQGHLTCGVSDPLIDQRLVVLRGLKFPELAPLVEPVEQAEPYGLPTVRIRGARRPGDQGLDHALEQAVMLLYPAGGAFGRQPVR
jgi:hypothetical protein